MTKWYIRFRAESGTKEGAIRAERFEYNRLNDTYEFFNEQDMVIGSSPKEAVAYIAQEGYSTSFTLTRSS